MAARRRRSRSELRSSEPSPASTASSRSRATWPTRSTGGRSSSAAGDRIDLLVNNAGVLGPSPQPALAAYPLDELARVYEVNVFAPLALVQEALPRLAPGAAILDITSDAAVEPYEGWGGYGSSKAALEQLTAILAAEQPRAARLRRRPGRHAHADVPGGVPGRGHLAPAAAGGERARPARADRGLASERPLPGARASSSVDA